MDDLISRAAAIDEVMQMVERHRHEIFRGELLHYTGVKAMLEALPAVDAVPVVHGRWEDRGSLSCRCSCCGCKSNAEYNYCPNCGAKMNGEQRLAFADQNGAEYADNPTV